MNSQLRFGLIAIGSFFVMQLLQLILVLVQLMRMRLWPATSRPMVALPSVRPDEQAAIDEVEALGFQQMSRSMIETGPYRYVSILLRHGTLPIFASLTLQPMARAAYPVSFFTFLANGQLRETVNRLAWALMGERPGVLVEDPCSDSLHGHWQAHRARIEDADTVVPGDEEVVRRVAEGVEGYLPMLREQKLCIQSRGAWHPTLRAAAVAAMRWMRARHKLARPYHSTVTEGPVRTAYHVHCYEHQEVIRKTLPPRHNVKAFVLVASLLASIVLWGWALSWSYGLAIVAIIVLHEGGHAVAMRAFGYRDMSMFFIPFIGAVVSGTPANIAAWKQAVILFAGPLPGIVAGFGLIAFLASHPAAPPIWHNIAWVAVVVNLFNLLPLAPLDGGRLVELAVFGRWPRSRALFGTLSALTIGALAYWLQTPALTLVAIVMAFSIRSQWRMAQLQREWREGAAERDQLEHLFAVIGRRFAKLSSARQYLLVRSVFSQRAIGAARPWESAMTLGLLVALWSSAGVTAYRHWPSSSEWNDDRTAAQREFDRVFDEDPDSDGIDELKKEANNLAEDDPRLVDLRVREIWASPSSEHREKLADVLAEGHAGYRFDLEYIEREFLRSVVVETAGAAPDVRITALTEAVGRAEALFPAGYAATVDTRLRVLEAIDQQGKSAEAETRLRELHAQVLALEGHAVKALADVVSARAWFFLSKGRVPEALELLQASPLARSTRRTRQPSLVYAWALLAAGRVDEGVDRMRRAAYGGGFNPTTAQQANGCQVREPYLIKPLDMAYALRRAGRDSEARALITRQTSWACYHARLGTLDSAFVEPWQQSREAALRETSLAICPHRKRRHSTPA